jgi:hypothetical protein
MAELVTSITKPFFTTGELRRFLMQFPDDYPVIMPNGTSGFALMEAKHDPDMKVVTEAYGTPRRYVTIQRRGKR